MQVHTHVRVHVSRSSLGGGRVKVESGKDFCALIDCYWQTVFQEEGGETWQGPPLHVAPTVVHMHVCVHVYFNHWLNISYRAHLYVVMVLTVRSPSCCSRQRGTGTERHRLRASMMAKIHQKWASICLALMELHCTYSALSRSDWISVYGCHLSALLYIVYVVYIHSHFHPKQLQQCNNPGRGWFVALSQSFALWSFSLFIPAHACVVHLAFFAEQPPLPLLPGYISFVCT